MPELTVYRHAPVTGPDVPESPTYLGDWNTRIVEGASKSDYLWHEYLSGSDYSGNAVEKSNHDAFLEQFGTLDGVLDVYGAYGTYGVLIRRDVYESNEDIREQIARLENYPVLDEERMGELEMIAEDEAWESWACSDFCHALIARFPEYEDALDNVTDGDLRGYFESECDAQNVYWENETGNSAWIRVEDVARDVDLDTLDSFLAAHASATPAA